MNSTSLEPIAIIGMGCRFPGAASVPAFWKFLREAGDAIGEIPATRWDIGTTYDPDPACPGKMISRWGGFIDQVDQFDWRAFRMSPREALNLDPQHRLLLEVAWEALEDAGLPLEQVAGSRTSVCIGMTWHDYLTLQAPDRSHFNGYTPTGNLFAFAANRLSYTFDLRGPSLALDTACASSLAALHCACQMLWMGEATLALAGGVELLLAPDSSIMMSKAGLLSPRGRCKTLDKCADGFVRGEGAGLIVLKPLSQVQPGDRVYALIRGIAVNHNGHNEWIMAPSRAALEEVLRDAYRKAAIDPADLDYVELHGIGLPKGDQIEVQALGNVVGRPTGRRHPCRVGSVKTSIGSLGAAAGIASIIKVALALYHREIPPTAHFQHANPAMALEPLGLVAQQTVERWPDKDRAALAGVTVTSFSGSNGHAVLEAPPGIDRALDRAAHRAGMLLPLSARGPQALTALAEAFAAFLATGLGEDDAALRDICYTASVRRSHHEHRLALVGSSRQELIAALEAFLGHEDRWGWYASGVPPCSEEHADAEKQALATIGALYTRGYPIDWAALYADGGRCTALPAYPWQRERLWPEWLSPSSRSHAAAQPSVDGVPDRAHPAATGLAGSAGASPLALLVAAPPGERRGILLAYLREQVIQVLGLEPSYDFKPRQGLFATGLDSITATDLRGRLEAALLCSLPTTLIFENPTLEALADYLSLAVSPSSPRVDQLDQHSDRFAEPQELNRTSVARLSEDEVAALILQKLAAIDESI